MHYTGKLYSTAIAKDSVMQVCVRSNLESHDFMIVYGRFATGMILHRYTFINLLTAEYLPMFGTTHS